MRFVDFYVLVCLPHEYKKQYQRINLYNQSQFCSIFWRFISSVASRQLQLNYCQSSLLSLSSTASFFSILLDYSLYLCLLYWDRLQPRMQRVSLNLRDNLFVLKSTTMNFWFPDQQQVAKQGPAVTVTPVFTPTKPVLRSNLLVFSQINYFFPPSFCTQSLYNLVLITLQKRGMFIQAEMSKARSQGVDTFLKSGRPCGFPKLDCFSSISLAYLFMHFTNTFKEGSSVDIVRRFPPHQARLTAASLPLGNISPQRSSQTVRISPTTNYADVPVISEARSQTVTF